MTRVTRASAFNGRLLGEGKCPASPTARTCGPQLFRSGRLSGCELNRGSLTVAGGIRATLMVKPARHLLQTILAVTRELASLASSAMRSRAQLAAENLFLRKQLALYQERTVKPRRADDATRIVLAGLSRFLAWRQLLVIVKPETLIRWHRKGFRLFWRWKSGAPGRPAIPANVQRLIATMAAANRTWGEERIAAELLLKLGIRVSPRTVRRYMPSRPPRPKRGTQAWSTFVRNHARFLLTSDFFVVVTATFRLLYVCSWCSMLEP